MRVTKKQIAIAQEFDTDAAKIVVDEYDAVPVQDDVYGSPRWCLKTTFGDLMIWPQSQPSKDQMFTVFCRFQTDDRAILQRAGMQIGSNPYSGKYNFHQDGGTVSDALFAFRMHLQRVTVA